MIGIVVLNWNGGADTVMCLESLEGLSYPHFRVILVDNGSTDGSVDLIRRQPWRFELDVVETGVNLGYAGGNNVGIRRAAELGCEFVLILNNDTVVAADLLDRLVGAAGASPAAGVFGPYILYTDRPDTLWFAGGRWNPDALLFEYLGQGQTMAQFAADGGGTDYVCGAAIFLRASLIDRIGLLDTRFFLVFEESDWCFRARRAGFECCMVPEAHVWHKVGASFGSEASPLRRYFSTRNELLWAEKNLPLRDRARIFFRALKRHVPRFSIAAKHRLPLAKRISWGTAQFLRDWRRMMAEPRQRASRRGLRDYVLRRFGDCPAEVRALSREWSTRAAEPVAAAGGGAS